ncbi:hypothetical protein [Halovenus sp. HT40]|uniref:hypothetical protein n=1 Tax=Halovenus sp. HT40 TaxID=3126691 RepID=UPI00300E810A
MTDSPSARIERVGDDLRDRGFTVDTHGSPRIARDGPTDLTGVDAPLAVASITDSNPLTVISAVAAAAHDGRVPVLVVDQHDYDQVAEILSSPFALAGEQDSLRQFYTVEDRIQLTDDSFACVEGYGPLSWAESGSTESPQLHLTVGEETVAVLDSVAGLACPGPSPAAFRHRYARNEDGRFLVSEGEAVVGDYSGVTAMRADGVRPVPLPLVPEHHVRSNGHLARAVLVATVEDGVVRYTGAQ